ncbi:MAG: hypothetical protein PHO32_07065, partial [Candidatus Cloacimonetes bacterium]|nr:hypothetical protein [Candidatus Cloacimonadota bacterium]
MANSNKFYFWEERRSDHIIMYGDEAPVSLRIKGNIAELKKLVGLITDAITYASEPGCVDGIGEDDIDDQHVLIEA